MTAQSIVLDLLQYIGVTGFLDPENANALNRPGVDDTDITRAISAVNSAIQTMIRLGPHHFSFDRRSVNLVAPYGWTGNVVNGGGITFPSTPPAWFRGSSIRIDGDGDLNEIRDITGNVGSLLHGYLGSTATGVSVVVYNDSPIMDSDVKRVFEPVELSPNRLLWAAPSRAAFDRFSYQANSTSTPYSLIQKQPGTPTMFQIETLPTRLLAVRLNPMPSQQLTITCVVSTAPEAIDNSALGEADNVDPGYEFTTLDAEVIDSILLPIARYMFSAHPAWKNAEARAVVNAQYVEAMKLLRQGAPLENRVVSNRGKYI